MYQSLEVWGKTKLWIVDKLNHTLLQIVSTVCVRNLQQTVSNLRDDALSRYMTQDPVARKLWVVQCSCSGQTLTSWKKICNRMRLTVVFKYKNSDTRDKWFASKSIFRGLAKIVKLWFYLTKLSFCIFRIFCTKFQNLANPSAHH